MVQHLDVIFDSTKTANRDYPNFILEEPIENVVGISLIWINVPNAYYNIDNTNNVFDLRMRVKSFEASLDANDSRRLDYPLNEWRNWTCVIKPGGYNAESLKNELLRAVNQVNKVEIGGRSIYPIDSGNFNFYIYPEDNRLLIWYKETGARETEFQVKFPPKLAAPLGFIPDYYWPDFMRDANGNAILTNGQTRTARLPVFVNGKPETSAACQTTGSFAVKLLTTNTLNLHSSLSNFLKTKDVRSSRDIVEIIPVTANYGQYIFHQHAVEMQPTSSREIIYGTDFYLTQGYTTVYDVTLGNAPVRTSSSTQEYVSLNGEGFQVAVRFYLDDGTS